MDPQIQQLVQFFIVNGTQWVSEQRNRFRPQASQLSPEIRARLQSFFAQRTLDSVRVATVTEIENPAFYSIFENAR